MPNAKISDISTAASGMADADLLEMETAAGNSQKIAKSVLKTALGLTGTNSGDDPGVISVGMSVPEFLSVSGSPITGAGTLDVTLSGTALPAANGGTGQTSVASFRGDLQGTGLVAEEVGYREIPPNSQSANYTAVASDSGKSIDHPASDANTRTFTIPANASVAYPVGACLTFTNMTAEVVTIAITSDTMYLAGTGTTGSRSLAQYGVATARKLTGTTWLISGVGLT